MMNLVSGSLNAIRNTLLGGKPAPEVDFEATRAADQVRPVKAADPLFPPTVFVPKRHGAANDSRTGKDTQPASSQSKSKAKFDLPPSPMDSVSADPLASTWMMDLPER